MTPAPTPATFGAWVKARRKQLDLTQSALGQRAGCSTAAIRKIEADERQPSRQLADLLAGALEIPAGEREAFQRYARGVLVGALGLAPRPAAHNLPTFLTSTVDRARDVAQISTLLRDQTVHLVTLVGSPGIGKTRLSIHAGQAVLADFPDGVWFVDLAEVSHPDFFVPTVARCLSNLELPPSPSLPQLISGLRQQTLLLILDNFEQIAPGASLALAQVLKTCPQVKALVTSRVPLHLYGEHEYPLSLLSVPPRHGNQSPAALMQFEAVQLLVARVRQHQPQFALTAANAESVVDLCATLDGLPLALELAAATLRQMPLPQLSLLLRGEDWVKQLTTSARDVPPRQRTLEHVIDWSFARLPAEQKTFFSQLGVFASWFGTAAAAAVCGTTQSVTVAGLNALADHSLLVRESDTGETRWRLLEFIRGFARARLSPEQTAHAELRRARHYLEQVQALGRSGSRAAQEAYCQANVSNIHGALQWLIAERQTELGFQIVAAVKDAWTSLGYFQEGLALLRQLLALPTDADPRLRAARLQDASDLAWQQHAFETALAYAEQAVALGRLHDLEREYPWYLNRLGRIYIEQGQLAQAKETLGTTLELALQSPSILNPGIPQAQLGEVALFAGQLAEAQTLLEQALPHLADDGGIFLALAQTDLAEVALAQGDLAQAGRRLRLALEPARAHARRFIVFLCVLAGYLGLSSAGDPAQAAQYYGAIQALGDRSGVVLGQYYHDLNQARMRALRRRLTPAAWQRAIATGSQWTKADVIDHAQRALHPAG